MRGNKANEVRALLALGKALNNRQIAKRVGCDVSYVYAIRKLDAKKQQSHEANKANNALRLEIKWNNNSYKFEAHEANKAIECIEFLNAHVES